MRVVLLGDSTVHRLYDLALETKPPGFAFEYQYLYGCLEAAHVLALSESRPDAVVWNIGLHLLHFHPYRPCSDAPAQSHFNGFTECGPYEHVVRKSVARIHAAVPDAALIWKTTNAICDAQFRDNYQRSVFQWHNNVTRPKMIAKCERECEVFQSRDRKCEDEIFDRFATARQANISRAVIARLPFKVGFLDSFAITDGHCNETGVTDGRHYAPLRPQILSALLAIINNTHT